MNKPRRRRLDFRAAARWYVARLHRDDRGAIAVLVILTIWCLIALLGMVVNTVQQAHYRAVVQTAADTASHGSAAIVARAINVVVAGNLAIGEDASTEVIWRAIPPTDNALNNRLNSEIAALQAMLNGNQLTQAQQKLNRDVQSIADEWNQASQSLSMIAGGSGVTFANPNDQQNWGTSTRQSAEALNWVMNTYMGGLQPTQVPGAPARPGPPSVNGVNGLIAIIRQYQPAKTQTDVVNFIIDYIQTTERPYVVAFENQTASVVSQPVDQQMAEHEAEVYANEEAQVESVPQAVEDTLNQVEGIYGVKLTIANLQNQDGVPGRATINAPLIPASQVQGVTGHDDLIREEYPIQTAAAGLSPTVDIDPINWSVHDSRVWHPSIAAPVDPSLQQAYPGLRNAYMINCNLPGDPGWGHIYSEPLEHFIHDRVNRDLTEIQQTFMVPLDQSRTGTLAQDIRQMLGLPNANQLNIAQLPGQIPDDTPAPAPWLQVNVNGQMVWQQQPQVGMPAYGTINVLPKLTAPAGAPADFRTYVDQYNQHGAAFTGAVRNLLNDFNSYVNTFQRFTTGFANIAWQTNVNQNCILVLDNLGQSKPFYVLATYKLAPIPDWAQQGLASSATIAATDAIVRMNIDAVARQIVADLQSADPNGIGAGYLDPTTRSNVTYGAYIGQATRIADSIIRPAAQQAAGEIAAEWLNRPWPYEITPPTTPVPPSQGMLPVDRLPYFTLMAAAEQTDATTPNSLMPADFFGVSGKLVAYAQAEAFNWMEFNSAYGGGETFDQIVMIPEVTYSPYGLHNFVAAPRGWRVGSVGGFNWRSRISFADALGDMAQNNQEFSEYLNDAGITNQDKDTLNAVNWH